MSHERLVVGRRWVVLQPSRLECSPLEALDIEGNGGEGRKDDNGLHAHSLSVYDKVVRQSQSSALLWNFTYLSSSSGSAAQARKVTVTSMEVNLAVTRERCGSLTDVFGHLAGRCRSAIIVFYKPIAVGGRRPEIGRSRESQRWHRGRESQKTMYNESKVCHSLEHSCH